MKHAYAALVTGILATTSLSPAFAQNIPGAAQPGRELQNLSPVTSAQSTVEDVIAPSNLLTAPQNANEITFELKNINITGATAFKAETLQDIYQSKLGQTVTLAEVYDIANRITTLYRSHGYLISQAIIPPQDIENGIVTIRVVEGFVNRINFRNASGSLLEQAELSRAADRIRASQPLNKNVLERQMLLLNDLAGVEARAIVEASPDVVGAADMTIEVVKRKFEGDVQVDNRGSRYLGPIQMQANAAVNGVFAGYDRVELLAAASSDFNELRLGEIKHIIPLNSNGLKASWRVAYSNTAPGFNLSVFDVKGKNLTAEGLLSYPVIRGRRSNLEFYGGLAWQDLETKSLGVKISDETLTTAKLGATYKHIDTKNGRSAITFEMSQGLGVLGASDKNDPLLSRTGANPQATKWTAEASREQFFTGSKFSFVTAVKGQYSNQSLVASQEFGLGGSAYGRAYDPSEITGDSGMAAKLEARYTSQPAKPGFIKTYQPYAYYDVGFTADNNTTNGRNSLASAGVGVRMAMAKNLALEVEVAKPLTRNVSTNGDDDPRVFFTLSKSF